MKPLLIVARGWVMPALTFPYPVVPKGSGGYIYVMGPPTASWVKVGITVDLRQRLKGFMSESGSDSIALFHAVFHPLYRSVEQCAHIALQEHRMLLERFKVTAAEAVAAVNLAAATVSRDPSADFIRSNWTKKLAA